jgi:transcriptional regulator with XRE-family HTH domain
MANDLQPDSAAAIGTRLRLIRLAYGILKRQRPMSQVEFARHCGITAPAWNNAETGDHRIGIDSAMAVSRRTGITFDYIYLGNSDYVPYVLAIEIEKIARSGSHNVSESIPSKSA